MERKIKLELLNLRILHYNISPFLLNLISGKPRDLKLVFQCPNCNFGSDSLQEFRTHYGTERLTLNWPEWSKRIYNCVVCEEEIRDEDVLGKHYK